MIGLRISRGVRVTQLPAAPTRSTARGRAGCCVKIVHLLSAHWIFCFKHTKTGIDCHLSFVALFIYNMIVSFTLFHFSAYFKVMPAKFDSFSLHAFHLQVQSPHQCLHCIPITIPTYHTLQYHVMHSRKENSQ